MGRERETFSVVFLRTYLRSTLSTCLECLFTANVEQLDKLLPIVCAEDRGAIKAHACSLQLSLQSTYDAFSM